MNLMKRFSRPLLFALLIVSVLGWGFLMPDWFKVWAQGEDIQCREVTIVRSCAEEGCEWWCPGGKEGGEYGECVVTRCGGWGKGECEVIRTVCGGDMDSLNVSCSQASGWESSQDKNGGFFKVTFQNPSPGGPVWDEPDSYLHEVGEKVLFDQEGRYLAGVSADLFGFDYRLGLSVKDSFQEVYEIYQYWKDVFENVRNSEPIYPQYRSFGFLKIPETSVYQFKIIANRSTIDPDPNYYYCSNDPPWGYTGSACKRDGGWDDKKGNGLTGACCTRCITGNRPVCKYYDNKTESEVEVWCDPACKLDFPHGDILFWLAGNQNDPEHPDWPTYAPPNYNPSLSFEENFANYDGKWFEGAFFSVDLVDPNHPDDTDTGNWNNQLLLEAGYYPFQFSADFPLWYPQLWWRRIDPATGHWTEWYKYGTQPWGSQITSCQPGANSCQCNLNSGISFLSGETKDVVLGSLENYIEPVTVSSSDSSALNVNSVTVDNLGNVVVNATAGVVDTVTTVNLTINASSRDSGGDACGGDRVPCTIPIVVQPGKFWQAKNADVIASSTIKSSLPSSTDYLLLAPGSTADDTPGVAFYGSDIITGEGSVSSKGWKANSNLLSAYSLYDYSYFEGKVPSEVRTRWEGGEGVSTGDLLGLPLSNFIQKDGYKYYKVAGDLTLDSSIQVMDRLVVLVEGDLYINSNLSLSDFGTSSLIMVVKGRVLLSGNVTRLDGVYVTDSSFETGTQGSRQDDQLRVNGIVVASSFNLQRSLPSSIAQTTPAELFEYKPSLLFAMPHYFYARNYNWREVNP